MIQCPNCGKDIADDSAHCGYCGQKIETGAGKKTMMGFAAMTPEKMKEAAEEARRAREQAQQQQPQQQQAQQQPPQQQQQSPQQQQQSQQRQPPASTPALPSRPQKKQPDGRPKLPNIPRPTPSAGTPAAPPKIGGKLGGGPGLQGDGVSSDAETAVMAAVGDAPPTVDEDAVGPDFAADTNPSPPPASPTTVPTAPASEDTLPEGPTLGAPAGDSDGPTEFGGGPVSDGPTEFGTGSNIQVSENTLPEKKKNPAVIVIGVVAVLAFMCCLFWTAYSFLLPIILG